MSDGVLLREVASAAMLPPAWEALRRPEQVALAPEFLRAFESSGIRGVESRYLLAYQGEALAAGAAVHRVEVALGEQRFPWTKDIVRRAETTGRPELLRFECLFCGLNASQGRDDVVSGEVPPQRDVVLALAERFEERAAEEDLDGIVFGHLHEDRLSGFEPLVGRGYIKLPSLAYATLDVSWGDLQEYLALLRSGYRRQARADLETLERGGFELCPDLPLAESADEFFPLYEAVVARAEQRVEVLTPDFFRRLGKAYPEHAALVGIRRRGQLAAGAVVLRSADRLCCLEVGLDYGLRGEGALYGNLLLALADRAGRFGLRQLDLGQTATEAKTRLGARLEPTWLLLKARSPLAVAALSADRPHLEHPPEPVRRVFRDSELFRQRPPGPQGGRSAASDPDRAGAEWARRVNPEIASLLSIFRLDRTYVRGEGHRLWDSQGREVLDLACGYGALPFGHNPPEVWEALLELRETQTPNFVQGSLPGAAGALAAELCRLAPAGLDRCVFASSGAEAVEVAIKAARAATRRPEILAASGAFHGKTLGALSATADPWYQEPFAAPAPDFARVRYGDPAALDRALQERRGRVAAFLVEPILGEGGVVVPPPGYLRACEEVCRRHGVLLLVDEVQTGLGRTGRLFACEEEGIAPDGLILSKALSGGLVPSAACLLSERAWSEPLGLRHSTTFAGGALAAAAGLAVLRRLGRDGGALLAEVRRKGDVLQERLRTDSAWTGAFGEVRGRGLMIGVELGTLDEVDSPTLRHLAKEGKLVPLLCGYLLQAHGLRVLPTLSSKRVLRLLPSLDVPEAALDRAVEAFGEVAERLARADARRLSGYVIGLDATRFEGPAIRRTRVSKGDPSTRFAFLVHGLDLQSYRYMEPSMRSASDVEMAAFERLLRDLGEVVELSHVQLESPTGALSEGWFLGVLFTARRLLRLPPDERDRWLRKAVAEARKRGAELVGLGAYTGVVSRGGLTLRNEGVGLTTGNAYTVATALEALRLAAAAVGIDPAAATCAVVGAAGSIGRISAILLGGTVGRLLLVGNPNRQGASERLGATARDVERETGRRPACTLDLEGAVRAADLLLCATSAGGPIVGPEWLRPGAVVCDVAKPPDVSSRVRRARNDVLVIDGGLVEVPGRQDLGWNFGFEPGFAYACMAETISLAWDGHRGHGTIGARLSPQEVREAAERAERHGFRTAGFRSFGRQVTDAEIQAVRRNAGR